MSASSNRFRLLIFDWDGTVMDSAATIIACMRLSLQEAGLTPPGDDRLRSTIGLGLDAVLRTLLPDADDAVRRKVQERYRDNWISTYHAKPIPFDGVAETLDVLGRDYVLAVATGKGRTGLERDFRGCDLGRHFAATRTVNECASKPSPHMVLDLLEELGCRADETLVIGDTTYDLDMAHNAGASSVAVLTGAHDKATLMGSRPLDCLDGARHLPEWLAGQG